MILNFSSEFDCISEKEIPFYENMYLVFIFNIRNSLLRNEESFKIYDTGIKLKSVNRKFLELYIDTKKLIK